MPATLLIDFDYPPWHTAEDTLDKVSAQSLAVVGEVLLEALPSVELLPVEAAAARDAPGAIIPPCHASARSRIPATTRS